MQTDSGHSVLDVGCGPATDTIPLAHLVGPTGQVLGIDWDKSMIFEANKRATEAGVGAWVRHEQEDASSLSFDNCTFNSCRSERLFQHLSDPKQVLSEMIRVTKPSGWIVVAETDWGTLSIDTLETDIERRLTRVLAERIPQNGYAGRQLYRLFTQEHLKDITFEIFPLPSTDYAFFRKAMVMDRVEKEAIEAGIISEDELRKWHLDLERAHNEGTLFACANIVVVAGCKT
jgi:ubiquinone/menaquinone biosynthesis C-methylase UbiE